MCGTNYKASQLDHTVTGKYVDVHTSVLACSAIDTGVIYAKCSIYMLPQNIATIKSLSEPLSAMQHNIYTILSVMILRHHPII